MHQSILIIFKLNVSMQCRRYITTVSRVMYVLCVAALQRSQLSAPCFTLPGQYDNFLTMSSSLGPSVRWVLKSSNASVQLVQLDDHNHLVKIPRYGLNI